MENSSNWAGIQKRFLIRMSPRKCYLQLWSITLAAGFSGGVQNILNVG